MITKIDKKGLRTILQNYFNAHDEMGDTRIEFRKETFYDQRDDERYYRTVIHKVTEKKMLGQTFVFDAIVEDEELRNILNEVFEKKGIIFEGFRLLDEINYVTTGYGLGERTEKVHEFKGIEANVNFVKGYKKVG